MLRHWWNQIDLRAEQFFFPWGFFLSLLGLAPLPLCRDTHRAPCEQPRHSGLQQPGQTSKLWTTQLHRAPKSILVEEGTHRGETWLRPCSVCQHWRVQSSWESHSIGTAGLGRELWTSPSPIPEAQRGSCSGTVLESLQWSLHNGQLSKQCTGLFLIVCRLNVIRVGF